MGNNKPQIFDLLISRSNAVYLNSRVLKSKLEQFKNSFSIEGKKIIYKSCKHFKRRSRLCKRIFSHVFENYTLGSCFIPHAKVKDPYTSSVRIYTEFSREPRS